jgi:hypothetical protein
MAAYLSQSGLKNSDRRVKPVDTLAAVDKAVVDRRGQAPFPMREVCRALALRECGIRIQVSTTHLESAANPDRLCSCGSCSLVSHPFPLHGLFICGEFRGFCQLSCHCAKCRRESPLAQKRMTRMGRFPAKQGICREFEAFRATPQASSVRKAKALRGFIKTIPCSMKTGNFPSGAGNLVRGAGNWHECQSHG